MENLKAILLDPGITKTEKKAQIVALLQTKEKQVKELAALLVGASVSLDKLFDQEAYKNLEESKLQFDSASYEERKDITRKHWEIPLNLLPGQKQSITGVLFPGF